MSLYLYIQKKKNIFRNQTLQPHFGDILINVDGKTLRAHRDLLAYHSSVIAEMINNIPDQSTQVLDINDFKFQTILANANAANEYKKGVDYPIQLLEAALKYVLLDLHSTLVKFFPKDSISLRFSAFDVQIKNKK